MSTVRNIVQAGNASANASVKAHKAIRDNSPKYDEIAKEGIKARAEEKIAAFQADAQVQKAGMDAAQLVKREKIDRDMKKDIRGIYRPAKIAKGFAGVVGAASLMVANKKEKSRTAIIDAARQKEIDRLTALRNEPYEGEKPDTSTLDFLNEQLEKLNGSRPTKPGDSTGASTPSSSGGKTVSSDISAQHSAGPNKLSKATIQSLAIDAGFTPEQARTVVGIAGGESGFDPTNSTVRSGLHAKTGEDSVGLMQINWGYHKDSGWLQDLGITSREQLFDPATNLKAAKYLYDGRGNFGDWTVYNKGIYRDYL